MGDWQDLLDPDERERLRRAPHPRTVGHQLARTATRPPSGGAWIHERKLDGVRLMVHLDGDEVRLMTRLGAERSRSFPELLDGVRALGGTDLVADGEVVAHDGERDSFGLLQRRLGGPGGPTASAAAVPVHLYLFDLLHFDGTDLRALPLLARKRLLASRGFVEPVRHVGHRQGDADRHLAQACADGWEGLIAKRGDGPYRSGRSESWLKLKCLRTGRFVVGGWTLPEGGRVGLGALLVGMQTPEGLRYAGRVGTGIDDATLETLAAHLRRIDQPSSPFLDAPRERAVRWAVPHLVVDVRFSGWTESGRLRHPSLVAVRPDLDPADAAGESI